MWADREIAGQGCSDQEFILRLYQEFHRLMFYIAQKYTDSQGRQEEIVQESLGKLVERAGQLRHFQPAVLASYIAVTVQHTAVDCLRMLREDREHLVCLEDLAGQAGVEAGEMDERLIAQEDIQRLNRALKKLDPKSRMVLEGKYFLGYDDQKLGRMLGCQPASVRMVLTRARRKTLELMRQEENAYDKS